MSDIRSFFGGGGKRKREEAEAVPVVKKSLKMTGWKVAAFNANCLAKRLGFVAHKDRNNVEVTEAADEQATLLQEWVQTHQPDIMFFSEVRMVAQSGNRSKFKSNGDSTTDTTKLGLEKHAIDRVCE